MSTDVAQTDAIQPADGGTEQVSFQLPKKNHRKCTNDWRAVC